MTEPVFPWAKKFFRIVDTAERIFASHATWRTKFDMIFSADVSGAVSELIGKLDYYDPDMSHQEDVTAYVMALRERASDIRAALEGTEEG